METDNIFIPANGSSISENVAFQIETAILEGKIKAGERLPSERDLQVTFQTGRGVVREALKALKQKGIIEIKKGVKGGAYVKNIEVAQAGESLALLIRQRMIPVECLIEFRESTDRTVTTLAIARGDVQEKKTLVELTDSLCKAALEVEPVDLEKIAEIDRNLNLILARMTKNPVFEWVMRTIQISFSSYDSVLYEDPYYREKTVINWRNTAREICSEEPLKALSFIGYHYVLLQRCIKEKGYGAGQTGKEGDGVFN